MSGQPEPTEAVDGAAEETAAERHSRLAAEREHRLGKVEAIRHAGGEPYPYRFDRTALAAELHEEFGSLEAGKQADVVIWRARTSAQIPYWPGASLVRTVIKKGRVVLDRT